MELRHLRFAVELGRMKHFTHAAERLGVAQPALSQVIAALERELGVTLFVRSSRKVEPTHAGASFLERAARILSDIDDLNDTMREHAASIRGRVTLSTMIFFGASRFPAAIKAFSELYPGIEIVFTRSNDSLDDVRSGKIDAAMLNKWTVLENPEFEFVDVDSDEIALALPPNHPAARKRKVAFKDLGDEPFVGYEPGSTLHNVLDALGRRAGFTPRTMIRSSNIALVRAMVSEGVGLSIGPKTYWESPGLEVVVRPLEPLITIDVSIAIGPSAENSPAARAFVNFLRTYYARCAEVRRGGDVVAISEARLLDRSPR
jgi:LysR family transcriptional regulator, hydrogen peroxide-inducible genes activator